MSELAIHARDLGKSYLIRSARQPYATLQESIINWVSRPFRRQTKQNVRETVWALKDISLEIRKGDIVGIIGRNGVGKSTLLKLLSRITEPTCGSADIYGRVGALLEVGTGFHPELTGRENIFLSGAILGMRRREIMRRFDEIVAFAEVEQYIDTPAKYYSSGMYLRLAFAVAAHLDTEILVVDEVLAVGDAAFQKKCIGKMEGVSQTGRTVLFVSHQLGTISTLCTSCILLDKGRIVYQGQTDRTIDLYLNLIKGPQLNCSRTFADSDKKPPLIISDIWMENKEGVRLQHFLSGDPIKIVAKYEIGNNRILSDVDFGFSISTSSGIQVTEFNSTLIDNISNQLLKNSGRVECFVPKLNINSGTFIINVIARAGRGIKEVLDWVQNAYTFTVEPGDYYGYGHIPGKQYMMMIDFSMNLIEEEF